MEKTELIKRLADYHWDETNVELAIIADFKCEYCGKDLLENIDNYKLWQVDHIIPRSSQYTDCENFENKALSCTQCNKDLKGKWNPVSMIGEGKTRQEYITEVIRYIEVQREKKNTELVKIRTIVNEYRESISVPATI